MKKNFNYWQNVARVMNPELEAEFEKAENGDNYFIFKTAIKEAFGCIWNTEEWGCFGEEDPEDEVWDEELEEYVDPLDDFCFAGGYDEAIAFLKVKVNQWKRKRSSIVNWYEEELEKFEDHVSMFYPKIQYAIYDDMKSLLEFYEKEAEQQEKEAV